MSSKAGPFGNVPIKLNRIVELRIIQAKKTPKQFVGLKRFSQHYIKE